MNAPPDPTSHVIELLAEIRDLLRAERQPLPLLLSAGEAAALVGIGRRTFHRYIAARSMPQPVSPGDQPMWRRADVEAAVARLKPRKR